MTSPGITITPFESARLRVASALEHTAARSARRRRERGLAAAPATVYPDERGIAIAGGALGLLPR